MPRTLDYHMPEVEELVNLIVQNAQSIQQRATTLRSILETAPDNAMAMLDGITIDAGTLRNDAQNLIHELEYIREVPTNKSKQAQVLPRDEMEEAVEEEIAKDDKPQKQDRLDKFLLLLDPKYREYLNEGKYKVPRESANKNE